MMTDKQITAAQRNLEQRVLRLMRVGQGAGFGREREIDVIRIGADSYTINGQMMTQSQALEEIASYQYDNDGNLVKA